MVNKPLSDLYIHIKEYSENLFPGFYSYRYVEIEEKSPKGTQTFKKKNKVSNLPQQYYRKKTTSGTFGEFPSGK